LDEIDMSYDKNIKFKELDVMTDDVKDRFLTIFIYTVKRFAKAPHILHKMGKKMW
jgi:hypothetical protein